MLQFSSAFEVTLLSSSKQKTYSPNPAKPGISRLTCDRSTSLPDGADRDAPSICSGDTSESDSSLASGQSSSGVMPGFLPDEMSFTHGLSGSSCSEASSALRVSS